MLYATEGVDSQADFQKAMVGVASVWLELAAGLLATVSQIVDL